jgi:hypothetical protein
LRRFDHQSQLHHHCNPAIKSKEVQKMNLVAKCAHLIYGNESQWLQRAALTEGSGHHLTFMSAPCSLKLKNHNLNQTSMGDNYQDLATDISHANWSHFVQLIHSLQTWRIFMDAVSVLMPFTQHIIPQM